MNEYFPNSLAINIAKQHDLYTKKQIPRPRYVDDCPVWRVSDKAGYQHDRLQVFQNVSLKLEFNECLKIYSDIKLTKKQVKALKLIHSSTPVWMKGKLVSSMMTELDNTVNTVGYTKKLIKMSRLITEILDSEH